jgi:hypothetical protein
MNNLKAKAMATSNKLIIGAVALTMLALITYDFFVKAIYTSGSYKIPYQGFATLPYKDFDRVDLVSSTAANAKFVQGPFSVRIDNDAPEYVHIRQEGSRLLVDASFAGSYSGNRNPHVLIISCPKLTALTTSATYKSYNKAVTDTTVRADWKMRQVLIDGFKQDSLYIEQDYGSTVILANNTIRTVNAFIGKSKASGSNIIVLAANHFQNFSLTAGNVSKFILENADIGNLSYHLADSAKLVVDGSARHLIYNSKKQPK